MTNDTFGDKDSVPEASTDGLLLSREHILPRPLIRVFKIVTTQRGRADSSALEHVHPQEAKLQPERCSPTSLFLSFHIHDGKTSTEQAREMPSTQ